MVNTRQVRERRALSFGSLDDILADVDALDGTRLRATGNWTPAQIVQHVTQLMDLSLDGFPASVPVPMRIFGRVFKRVALTRAMFRGIKFPPSLAPALEPPEDVAWEDAVDHLRRAVERSAGGRMTQPSPLFGPLSHEEWVKLHCRHAEMHFGFIMPE